MAANESASFCVICQSRDLNKLAEEYCPQCEEVLCEDCRHNHKMSKLSKSHQTIPIDKYNKLPSFIKQISHNCEEHGCVLEFHCKSHDSLCCKICSISAHKECMGLTFIENFLMSLKGHRSVALDNIEKTLKNLESNISFAMKDRNRNLTELHEQKRVIAEQIKGKRQEINILLDNFERSLLEKVFALETEYCQKIERVIAKLNEEKRKVDKIKKDVESVKTFASNIQILIGTKSFEENVSTNELNVQKLYDDGSLNNFTMECIFNEKLEQLIKDIKTFGDIEMNKCEKHASFSWKGDKSAQIFKPIIGDKSIENINATLVRKINTYHTNLTGCAISETGDMFFLQLHKNSLLKYGPNGEFCSKFRFTSGEFSVGYDLAVVDSNTLAMSTGGNYSRQLYLIDMHSGEPCQMFDLGDFCYGLSYYNGSFICCTSENGIKLYDKLSQKLTYMHTLSNAPQFVAGTYVTSNEIGIFHSNWRDNSVVCYNFCGQVQWKYSDSLLRKPYGITLDSYSNIFVAGSESNNIVVISKDGKQAKQLIGPSEGIVNPRAVFFHKTKNVLLVDNCDGDALLFDV